ncbi:MAG: 16S rRNA (uracil(1498)-N(3))-methyltransferase [Bacteroidales bacterium]
MHLFYSPDIADNLYTLSEEESKHCIRVLRLKTGDTIHLTDGRGNLFETRILNDHPKKCELAVIDVQKEVGKRDFHIHMAVAPTKNINRFEWFLEKATEIGIDEITPIICEHSERKEIKIERLNKVITAAIKQSLKAYHPVLNETEKFKSFIQKDFQVKKFIAYCDENYMDHLKNIYQKGENTLILIGPEGDFSPHEVELATKNGFRPISLGISRLRTETAGVAACHTVNLINE